MEIHVHIHDGSVKEGKAPRSRKPGKSPSVATPKKRKGKPMTRKTQLSINRGRKEAGLKPIKWKKKGV